MLYTAYDVETFTVRVHMAQAIVTFRSLIYQPESCSAAPLRKMKPSPDIQGQSHLFKAN